MTTTRTTHIPSEPTTNLVDDQGDPHGYAALGWLIMGIVWGAVIGGTITVLGLFIVGAIR
jgi:hypothetical protein